MKRITVGTVLNYFFICLVGLITLYPFIYILSTSITPSTALLTGRVILWPKGFDLSAYQMMFDDPRLIRGFVNTVLYTLSGTAVSVVVTAITAYPLAHPAFTKYANKYMKFVVFTMLFSAGIIPTFRAISTYRMVNTFWVMIIPWALSPFYLILTRTFMKDIPGDMFEAATIDGATHWGIFSRIIVPLSKPILACITFYYAIGIWNNYMNPLIYLRSDTMFPLQIFLRQIVLQASNAEALASSDIVTFNPEAIRSATLVISTLPILIAYPFLQKYFVKGLMVGAIKG